MATVMQTSLEGVRPQSHQGINPSPPASSPHIPRPASQASLHLAPATNGGYSPSLVQQTSPLPFSAYPMVHAQPMRQFQHGNMALPVPHTAFIGSGFPNAQPMQYFAAPEQYFDTRGSQPMIRTISHAHPMTSATEHTASSRFSASPHSFTHEAPPTAGYPSFNFSEPDERHINPAIFNSFPMSRSTSGASDMADVNARLLTPSYDPPMHHHEAELRKVSDSLGSLGRIPSRKYHGNTLSPHMEVMSPNIGLGPHSQPDMGMYVNAAKGWGSDFALSAERGKNDMPFQAQADTDYERERAEQIMNNKKLLEDIGLGGDSQFMQSRNTSNTGADRVRKPSTHLKRRLASDGPVRASPRIASQYRNVSYANLDGEQMVDDGSDEYNSDEDQDEYEEEDFRPSKRSKGGYRNGGGRRVASTSVRRTSRAELSLYGLLEVYPEIPHLFPLFYYTLNNDLTINSDSVPLIGSVPSTLNPIQKAETLRGFFHRGRRVLAQIDAFTSRCDKKYDGPSERWPELDYHTRIAIRDVRRKVVERCENYKYTRRDILNKNVGKGKWPPIESGMIEWRVGMTQNDPAGDLVNVTLTLPTPPPGHFARQTPTYVERDRQIKALPSRKVSGMPQSARSVSVVMAEPNQYATTPAPMMGYPYSAQSAPPPMYTQEATPMSMSMPMSSMSSSQGHSSPLASLPPAGMNMITPGDWEDSGRKRESSQDEESDQEDTLW